MEKEMKREEEEQFSSVQLVLQHLFRASLIIEMMTSALMCGSCLLTSQFSAGLRTVGGIDVPATTLSSISSSSSSASSSYKDVSAYFSQHL